MKKWRHLSGRIVWARYSVVLLNEQKHYSKEFCTAKVVAANSSHDMYSRYIVAGVRNTRPIRES
jgi:hypothetical protein